MAPSILLLILFHLLLSTGPTSSIRIPNRSEQTGFRATITRVGSRKTSPKYTSTNPLKTNSAASPKKYSLEAHNDLYIMSLAIGTPPVPFSAIMDTGSDLIWTKCKTGSLYNPSKSTSFSKVNKSCSDYALSTDCKQKYEDGTKSVSVSLGQETLTVGKKTIPNVIFACGKPNYKDTFDGIVGMGPGKLSLVSHLQKRVFSYCLGSRFDTKASSVLLAGSKASINNINVQTTPLVMDGSYYYISLEGISVGKTKLPVTKSDFAMSNNGDGGMIIDSGTTFTYLESRIVDMISDEFMNQTKLEKSEDNKPYMELKHCFKYQAGYNSVKVPNLVFHFKGANWELTRENYIYKKKGGKGGCLAFIANEDSDKPSIFGNMQQQNMMVIYDLEQKSLSFKHADNCNRF